VEIVQGAHGLLTLSNLYGNIYVNALGLYLPGGGSPDTIDPTGTVGTPTITDLSFTIAVTSISEDNVTVELLSSGGSQLVTSGDLGTTRSYTISHSETSGGTYSYTVRLTDAAGNTTDYAVSGVVLLNYETLTFTAEGVGSGTITGNGTTSVTIQKTTNGTGGQGNWNYGPYVTQGFTQPFTVEFKIPNAGSSTAQHMMMSLNDALVSDGGNYTSLDYASYTQETNYWDVYNNSTQIGNQITVGDSWDPTQINRIVYADNLIKHYNGSTLIYTSPTLAHTTTRYIDTSIEYLMTVTNIRGIKAKWDGSAYV
jgi:hypothetical protein